MSDKWVRRWKVPSHSDPSKEYTVAQDADGNYGCSCPRWTQRREECKHITEVKEGAWPETGKAAEPPALTKVLANVREVTVRQKKGEVHVPLIPIGNVHFALTMAYDLLALGFPWATVREWAHLSPLMTPKKINELIHCKGRLVYGPWKKGKGHQGFEIVWPKEKE